MSVFARNIARIGGGQPTLFSHGFGCDGNMRRRVARRSKANRIVLFDRAGSGA